MKNQKTKKVVMAAAFHIALVLLSGHPFEIAILFGSAYLLRWQAGGITLRGRFQSLAAITVFWIMGVVSYPFVCPIWVLYPLLLLVNSTVYFFAPATNQVVIRVSTEKTRKERETTKEAELREARAKKAVTELIRLKQQKKKRALFISAAFSIAIIITHRTPISSLLLLTLLAEMISILSVIWQALQKEPWEM